MRQVLGEIRFLSGPHQGQASITLSHLALLFAKVCTSPEPFGTYGTLLIHLFTHNDATNFAVCPQRVKVPDEPMLDELDVRLKWKPVLVVGVKPLDHLQSRS